MRFRNFGGKERQENKLLKEKLRREYTNVTKAGGEMMEREKSRERFKISSRSRISNSQSGRYQAS